MTHHRYTVHKETAAAAPPTDLCITIPDSVFLRLTVAYSFCFSLAIPPTPILYRLCRRVQHQRPTHARAERSRLNIKRLLRPRSAILKLVSSTNTSCNQQYLRLRLTTVPDFLSFDLVVLRHLVDTGYPGACSLRSPSLPITATALTAHPLPIAPLFSLKTFPAPM
jgi:hypothetical protein